MRVLINVYYLLEKLLSLPALLIAITFHELAHGYAAYTLGDPTAKNSGRLSLNPIKHIDPLGLIMLFLLRFGWAKPVPVNPLYFKNRKLGMIIVSIAGPITNFMLALLFALISTYVKITNMFILGFLELSVLYNIILGIFNLLPFPPLDGSKILASLLPDRYEFLFYKHENYLRIILIVMVITGFIGTVLNPLIIKGYKVLNILLIVIHKII